MHWLSDVGHQIALCQAVVVAVFALWGRAALGRVLADPNRGRIAIVAFTASWCVLVADFLTSRVIGSPQWRITHATTRGREAEWIVAAASLLAVYLAYRNGRIQATGPGPVAPTTAERSADAAERMALATEAIADQVAVATQERETADEKGTNA